MLSIYKGSTYIGVGSGINDPNGPGQVLIYNSLDTAYTKWHPMGSILNISQTNGCTDSKTMVYNASAGGPLNAIECPDLFLLQDKYVIITSLFCTNEYRIGSIDSSIYFQVENKGLVDYGNFYAGKTGTNAYGVNGMSRRVLFGFTGWSEPTAPTACGRSHVIPRDISLSDDGTVLRFRPVEEIEMLRVNESMSGSELQIILTCGLLTNGVLPKNGSLSFNVLANGDEEYTAIGYDFEGEQFFVDHRKCCNDGNNIIQIAPYENTMVITNGGLYFNVLLDRSIIEAFFNEERVITAMVNPSNSTAPEQRAISFVNDMSDYFDCQLDSWSLSL